jgi:hypothetical protein
VPVLALATVPAKSLVELALEAVEGVLQAIADQAVRRFKQVQGLGLVQRLGSRFAVGLAQLGEAA